MSNPFGFTPVSPGAPMARLRGAIVGVATAALLGAALPWTGAEAQRSDARATHITDERGRDVRLAPPQGFNLFSEADVAASGMRMTGNYGWQFPNVVGPCPWYFTNGSESCGLLIKQSGATWTPFFEFTFAAGIPITDFRKIRAVYPGVNNMRAPLGYSVPFRFTLAPPVQARWGAADGQFGALFAGVVSTDDGSCRDHTSFLSGRLPAGLTLTAGSDCPETWANGQFNGERLITAATFQERATASPSTFAFDAFRVPASDKEDQFLGDFSTYGAFSDHYREVLQRYGSVTPAGAGAPSERGFPLGLEVRYDAWQYSRPSIRNVVFYQMTIVNNTERVYGGGVDFDSLYFAFTPGFLNSGSGSQSVAGYFDMGRNAFITTGHGASGDCSPTYPRRVPGVTTGCTTTRAFADGSQAFVILKSPLGDTRNKLFTRPGSPFNIAGIPEDVKDDTITFNHARYSQFGAPANNFQNRNDKAFFGYMASIEDVFLDGRTAADFSAIGLTTTYRHFMGEEWRNFDGNLTSQYLRFPRFVPGATTQPATQQSPNPGAPYGSWDYNNDGVQDTIFVPGCGSRGCHDLYSDTLVSGLHNYFGNVTNILGMGPVRLAAGDTTQILLAMVGGADSSSFESYVNATIETYLNFYAGPASIPAPQLTAADVQITSAEVRDQSGLSATAQVRLRIPQLAPSTDPFVQRVADRLRTSTEPTIERLRRLNPNLVDQVQARADNNLAEILVFKSCDRGQTFTVQSYNQTSGAGCRPAEAEDTEGNDIGFGWQAFATIPVNADNEPQIRFINDIVQAGRTYLYSFVTRTRGIIDIPLVDSIAPGVVAPTNLAVALNVDADTIVSALARSGPSTVTVYAPISLPAGAVTATLDTSRVSGVYSQAVTVEQTGGGLIGGTYRVYFANRFIVRSTENTETGRILNTTVTAQRVLSRAQVGAGGTPANDFVADERVFTADGPIFTNVQDSLYQNLVQSGAGQRIYEDTLLAVAGDTVGYILVRTAGAGTGPRALYISTRSRGTTASTASQFENVAFFPGFDLEFEALPGGVNVPRYQIVLRAEGDTINRAVASNNGVVLLNSTNATSSLTRIFVPGGTYQFAFSDDAFGPGSNFTFRTAAQLQADVTASLQARTNVTQTQVSPELRAIVAPAARAAGADTTRPLVQIGLPFRVIGRDGQPAIATTFRRYRDGATAEADSIRNNSLLLGNAGDTVRVSVPSNVWVPGDTLYIVETISRDSTIGSAVVTSEQTIDGQVVQAPIQVPDTVVTLRAVLGCTGSATTPSTTAAPRCNPLVPNTFAATGYLPYQSGWVLESDFVRNFDLFSEFEIDATPTRTVGVALTAADVDDIRVVPNPYIVQSAFDDVQGTGRVGTARVLFTGVPSQGVVTIYSVSGQLIQQLTWTEADLLNRGQGTPNGDLPFVLRTREGLDMGSGLYVFVLRSTGPGAQVTKRGKFVIIR